MNVLTGIISDFQSVSHLSYVKVKLDETTTISTVILESPETLDYLKIGKTVRVLFKETELLLSKTKWEGSTMENSFDGTITKITPGEILTRVEIETAVGRICSIITTNSFNAIGISVDHPIVASIHSSEIMLSE